MSVLSKLACSLNRGDEAPNQELARELVETQNAAGIQELVQNLAHLDRAIRFDCIKALYEVGYLEPGLVAGYANDFLKLLRSPDNRLVWGGMLALSTVVVLKADELFPHVAEIESAMEKGSVITVDAGVVTLAKIAVANVSYNQAIFPYLLDHLQTCRPKDVPQHAEKTLLAVNAANKERFTAVLTARLPELSAAQEGRIRRVLRQVDAI